jgi:hypothetical protein
MNNGICTLAVTPHEKPKRRIEMVWCDLGSLSSFGRFMRSSGRVYSVAEIEEGTMKEKGRKGLGRELKSDSHGPYVEGKSPRLAHYALRVEVRFQRLSFFFCLF